MEKLEPETISKERRQAASPVPVEHSRKECTAL